VEIHVSISLLFTDETFWSKPFGWRRIRLVAEAVFLCGRKHAISDLVSLLRTAMMQQVSLSTVRQTCTEPSLVPRRTSWL
jgi:hypothetical protein